tara:strand:- start:1461 stop:1859 length:399 start_codon:yes stop_codon:yes gene_type:complete
MNSDIKSDYAYKTIGEVAKEIDLVNKKTGNVETHTIRYWESQFKQIRPTVKAGNRRYYSNKDLKIIKHIKYLLKDRGLTIKGVKKILNNKDTRGLDVSINLGVYKANTKNAEIIRKRIKNISKIVKELKRYK